MSNAPVPRSCRSTSAPRSASSAARALICSIATADAISTSAAASRSPLLGHAHPHLVATLKAQAEKLWHCSNLYGIERPGAAGRAAGRAVVRRHRVLRQLRRRGARVRDQDGAALPATSAARASASGSSPSRAPSTAARSRPSRPAARRSTSRGSARTCRASITCRSAISSASRRRSGPRPRRS